MTHPVLPKTPPWCAPAAAPKPSLARPVRCARCPLGWATRRASTAPPRGSGSGFLARAWHTGRLALVMAVAAFVGALWLPLAGGVMVRDGRGEVMLDVWVKPLDYVLGTY